MQKHFKQIMYYHPKSDKNTRGVTEQSLINGTAFAPYLPLSQLGVRTLPGIKFYLNDGDAPVIVGFTGLFEIDLSNGGSITSIQFDRKSIAEIAKNDNAYLIVDMLSMGGN